MNKSSLFFIVIAFSLLFTSCKKDRTISGFDAELFTKAQASDNWTYLNFKQDFSTPPNTTGHKSLFFRTKFNATAANNNFTDKGELIDGATFEDGSMIVNEMCNTIGVIDKYAIMYKDSKNEFADKNGWVWSYVNADNTIIEPASRIGISCIKCHPGGQIL
jgi:hypothetical protein